MDELREQIEELKNQLSETDKKLEEQSSEFNELKHTFDFHEHKGYDLSKEIDTASSGSVVYGGYIAADGTANVISTDWTSSNYGTGQYKITHNLGTTDYTVVGTGFYSGTDFVTVQDFGANDFNVVTWNSAITNENKPFTFAVIMIE